MIIKLTKKEYDLAKTVDFSDMKDHIIFKDDSVIEIDDGTITLKDYKDNEFEQSCLDLFFECITTEIEFTGMSDNQEEVLPRGRDLYDLHDNIYDAVFMD